eukprot:TRINITY_DN2097_c0_g1_i1.p1 TRINITY_DN2097_c0_g1~~TRINITY_DN2097_c0_g1_i1.p1  ORF type:complete len:571 (+),score=115.59 TRINITY_DN2097_c0_g1_i1:46-1713(+)
MAIPIDKLSTDSESWKSHSLEDGKLRPDLEMKAQNLVEAWSEAYGLRDKTVTKPPSSDFILQSLRSRGLTLEKNKGSEGEGGEGVWGQAPLAPHLEMCDELTQLRMLSEERDTRGAAPAWARKKRRKKLGIDEQGPQPPWVLGADEDNLPMTRMAQTDIWKHQFPVDCSQPRHKFLVIPWVNSRNHGLGSQLHLMAVGLGVALTHNRILVPKLATFSRANHSRCTGNSNSSLNCYFFPLTDPACEKRATLLLQKTKPKMNFGHEFPLQELRSKHSVVLLPPIINWYNLRADTLTKWGEPWRVSPKSIEMNGRAVLPTLEVAKASWWRAQAIRFMLRWPSLHLCHVLNRHRLQVLGLHIARGIVQAMEAGQLAISKAAVANASNMQGLEGLLQHGSATNPLEVGGVWHTAEPYLPRPIVSIHVRQGDKASEMQIFSFTSFMALAYRVRLHVPDLRFVWLSTEMESVVAETSKWKDWKFFYTANPRQEGASRFRDYETEAGVADIVEVSWTNLLLAAQCDCFVGALGSNWNRLINELRLTGGKLKAGYITLNNAEWR